MVADNPNCPPPPYEGSRAYREAKCKRCGHERQDHIPHCQWHDQSLQSECGCSSFLEQNHKTPNAIVLRWTQCEGFRRKGGAFTFGPATWTQCEADATVFLTFVKDDQTEATLPFCHKCWKEGIENKIKILKAEPI